MFVAAPVQKPVEEVKVVVSPVKEKVVEPKVKEIKEVREKFDKEIKEVPKPPAARKDVLSIKKVKCTPYQD